MKIQKFLLSLMFVTTVLPVSSFAAYEPFSLNCVYDATSDGHIRVTSKVDPDMDNFNFTLETVSGEYKGRKETLEFTNVFITTLGEDKEADRLTARAAKLLGADMSEYFTTTEFIAFDGISGPPIKMSFLKLNSHTGTIGMVVYVSEPETFVVCK